jgi:hypothetical protein
MSAHVSSPRRIGYRAASIFSRPRVLGCERAGALRTGYRTSSALALTSRASRLGAPLSDTECWAPPLVALVGLLLLTKVAS